MRNSLRIALALMLAVVAAGAVIALAIGCGGEGDDGSSGPQIATYTFVREPTASWDPAIDAADGSMIFQNVYENLLRWDAEKNEPVPVLAESYSVSPDGRTWTFVLRKGVKFHDGTDFEASDVKASIEHYQKVNQGYSYIWGSVESTDIVDDYTVQLNCSYAAPIDLVACAAIAGQMISGDALDKYGDEWLNEGNEAGTGPYMQQSQTTDEAVLTKFEGYWGGWEGEHFDKAVIKRVAEAATRRQMIEGGECDVTTDLTPEDYQALASNQDVEITKIQAYKNLWISFLTTRKPLSDVRVRQALSYAYPYQDAVDTVAGGFAVQARGVIPSTMWGSSPDIFQYTTDLDKAKELLAEAGYADGFELTALYATGDESKRKSLEVFKASLADLGIDLKIRSGPWNSVWEETKGNNPPDLFCMWWWPNYPDPYDWFYSMFRTEEDPYYNTARYSNPKVDALMDQASEMSAVDREGAAELYVQAQQLIMQDAPYVPVMEVQSVYVTASSFRGFVPNPAYEFVVPFYDCYRE